MGSCSSAPIRGEDHDRLRNVGPKEVVQVQPLMEDDDDMMLSIISSAIEKLESHRTSDSSKETERVMKDLTSILDFLKHNPTKWRNEGKLHYLICDVIDIAADLGKDEKTSLRLYFKIVYAGSWLRHLTIRILQFEVSGVETGSENVREGDNGDDSEIAVELEDEVELLLRGAILNETRGLWTSVVKGVTGIGKTALARKVYNHADVVDQFDRRAWVSVSNDLTQKEVLMEVIRQAVDCEEIQRDSLVEKMVRANNRSLKQILHQHLQGRRYLIVLDDIPGDMDLRFMFVFQNEDKGSRLMLTSSSSFTRNIIDHVHKMEQESPRQLKEKGMQMLRAFGSAPSNASATLDGVILQLVQKLNRHLQREQFKGVSKDLRIILDFLRDNKLGEEMLSRLHYLIVEVVEMVYQVLSFMTIKNSDIQPVQRWTREVKARMLQYGVFTTEAKLKSYSIGEGDDANVVLGFEDQVELLLGRAIFNEQKGYGRNGPTSLVTGIVGSGKTTLVRQVYNHAAVLARFERRAWVRVRSDHFSHRELLMALIQEVVGCEGFQRDLVFEKVEDKSNEGLQIMLHQHLEGMRYFIVLDNFPKEMHLGYILASLPQDDKGSKLMLTSWSGDIQASFCYVHHVKPLDLDKSWQLFMKTVSRGNKFTSKHNPPQHLKNQARDMLRRCGGLPLAIKEVGMQLAKKRRLGSEWEKLFETIDLRTTMEFLESGYREWDPQLKSCFLHLAFFKENTNIRIEKLEQIWTIAGMVSGEYLTMISSYVHMLARESIVEIIDDGMKTCRISSILHALSVKKAEEEIGFEILRNKGDDRVSDKPRHRVIHCSRDKFNHSTQQDGHLVSLFVRGGGYLDASPSYWKSFELVEILDMEDFGLKVLPEAIGTLIELRYLGLRNNYIQELPHSLGCLKKLQVFDIALNSMVYVSDVIWKMSSLLHLYMSDVICLKPLKIDKLRNLETLTYISADNWTTYELSGLQMTGIKKLGIEEVGGNSDLSKLFASLAKFKSLESLILRGFRFRSMPCLDDLRLLQNITSLKLEGPIARLPSAENFPPRIEYLKLVNCGLDEDPMPVLEKLRKLYVLKLQNAYTGVEMVITDDGFPALGFLLIEELWNLRNVRVGGEGAVMDLSYIEICNCPHLETTPEEIGPNVGVLRMVTTRKIATKARRSSLISRLLDVDIIP